MNITHITLNLTRKTLYLTVFAVCIFVILFPWSILAYWRFYNVLIPLESYSLPVVLQDVYSSQATLVTRPDTMVITNKLALVPENMDVDYEIVLEVALTCWARVDTGNRFYLNFNTNFTPGNCNPLVLQCLNDRLYQENNWLVPYKLRQWVPPFLVLKQNSITRKKSLGFINGLDLAQNLKLDNRLVVELDSTPRTHPLINPTDNLSSSPHVYVDGDSSILHIFVNWRGIRWFLFHHYIICFVLGVGIFWGVSCSICVSLALVVWGIGRLGRPKTKSTKGHEPRAIAHD